MNDGKATAWLRQVIEGDKAAAKEAFAADDDGQWILTGGTAHGDAGLVCGRAFVLFQEQARAAHIALHDPRDVIADCEAKLAVLDEFTARDDDADLMLGPGSSRQREWGGLRLAVRLLASSYRHREGYAEHWGEA